MSYHTGQFQWQGIHKILQCLFNELCSLLQFMSVVQKQEYVAVGQHFNTSIDGCRMDFPLGHTLSHNLSTITIYAIFDSRLILLRATARNSCFYTTSDIYWILTTVFDVAYCTKNDSFSWFILKHYTRVMNTWGTYQHRSLSYWRWLTFTMLWAT